MELLRLVEDYRRLKAELGLMDFSDQIELATRLAREHPDVGARERLLDQAGATPTTRHTSTSSSTGTRIQCGGSCGVLGTSGPQGGPKKTSKTKRAE